MFLRSCKTIINQSTNLEVPTIENTVISNNICSWQCSERRELPCTINQPNLDIERSSGKHPRIFKAPGLSHQAVTSGAIPVFEKFTFIST
jgi:hypothetical protein